MYKYPSDLDSLKTVFTTMPVACYVDVADSDQVMAKFKKRFPKLINSFDKMYQTTRSDVQKQDISANVYLYFPGILKCQPELPFIRLKELDFGTRSIMRENWKQRKIIATNVRWSNKNNMYYAVINCLDLFDVLHEKFGLIPGPNNCEWLYDDMVALKSWSKRRKRDEDE